MRAGASGTDDYLADWRKVSEGEREGTDAEGAAARAAELEAEWTPGRLRDVALAGGTETRGAA
jgi:hypothetical protein